MVISCRGGGKCFLRESKQILGVPIATPEPSHLSCILFPFICSPLLFERNPVDFLGSERDSSTWVPGPGRLSSHRAPRAVSWGSPWWTMAALQAFPEAAPPTRLVRAAVPRSPGLQPGARAGASQQDCAQGSKEISRPVGCYNQNSTQKAPHPRWIRGC